MKPINWSAEKNRKLTEERGTAFELDQEEKEFLKAFEAGKFESDMTPQRRAYLAQLAKASIKKV